MSDSADCPGDIPRHVAIIMDGNGRWAKARFLPRTAGHKQGVETTRKIVQACARRGVQVLTLFAFSSENWRRPRQEVGALMELFVIALRREVKQLAENNIRLRFIGQRESFPANLISQIEAAESETLHCSGMELVIAASYGGRWDVVRAIRTIADDVVSGRLEAAAVDEDAITSRLTTADLPEPDLFIRTGGEQPISNFLLWQLAYTELYFTPALWPEFDEDALSQAFAHFAGRQRRFGMTGDQVEALPPHEHSSA